MQEEQIESLNKADARRGNKRKRRAPPTAEAQGAVVRMLGSFLTYDLDLIFEFS